MPGRGGVEFDEQLRRSRACGRARGADDRLRDASRVELPTDRRSPATTRVRSTTCRGRRTGAGSRWLEVNPRRAGCGSLGEIDERGCRRPGRSRGGCPRRASWRSGECFRTVLALRNSPRRSAAFGGRGGQQPDHLEPRSVSPRSTADRSASSSERTASRRAGPTPSRAARSASTSSSGGRSLVMNPSQPAASAGAYHRCLVLAGEHDRPDPGRAPAQLVDRAGPRAIGQVPVDQRHVRTMSRARSSSRSPRSRRPRPRRRARRPGAGATLGRRARGRRRSSLAPTQPTGELRD